MRSQEACDGIADAEWDADEGMRVWRILMTKASCVEHRRSGVLNAECRAWDDVGCGIAVFSAVACFTCLLVCSRSEPLSCRLI